MRKLITIILLCLSLFNGLAYPANLGEEIAQAIGQLASVSIKLQMKLYVLSAFYYLKNERWPQDKQEFADFFGKMDEESEKEISLLMQSSQEKDTAPKAGSIKEDIDSLSKLIYYDFFPLDNGDLLIEGGFNQKLTKESTGSMNKFPFSTVAHKTEEGFSFSPSDKAKQNTGYLSMPFKFKIKQSPKDQPAEK